MVQVRKFIECISNHRFLALFLGFITIITTLIRYTLPVRDGDLWFHLLYGKYFIENKTLIPDHTIYSWTQSSNEEIYVTWFPDVVMYLIHSAFGMNGLYLLRYSILLFFIFAIFSFARKFKLHLHPLTWFIIANAVFMAYVAIYLKPEIFSFLFLTLLVWCWLHIKTGGKRVTKWFYAIPAILLVWVNSHGTYFVGVIFIVLLTIGEVLNWVTKNGNQLKGDQIKHAAIALFISAFTPLANPYGWHHPYKTLFLLLPSEDNLNYNAKIAAYGSPFAGNVWYHNYALYANIAIAIILILLIWQFIRRRSEWSVILLILFFTYFYSVYLRTTFFLAPVTAFATIYLMQALGFAERKSSSSKGRFRDFAIAIVTVGLCLYSVVNAIRFPEADVMAGELGVTCPAPIDSIEYIKEKHSNAKIGNSYNTGSYLLWKLWPEKKVFFDARHFPYKEWSDDFFAAREGGYDFEVIQERYDPDIWVIDHKETSMSSYLRASESWKLTYFGRCSQVFEKNDLQSTTIDNTYLVSDKLSDLRNYKTIFQPFLFALKIYDWKTADILIDAYRNNRIPYIQRDDLYFFSDLRDGIFSFSQRKYKETIDFIEKYAPVFEGLNIYLEISHLHLAQNYLNNGDFAKSIYHLMQAKEINPDFYLVNFNLGLVKWQAIKQLELEGVEIKKYLQDWRDDFQLFLQMANGNPTIQFEITLASNLLNGGNLRSNDDKRLTIPQIPILE